MTKTTWHAAATEAEEAQVAPRNFQFETSGGFKKMTLISVPVFDNGCRSTARAGFHRD
jgi:hypothetical protein